MTRSMVRHLVAGVALLGAGVSAGASAQQPASGTRSYAVTREERVALAPLHQAVSTNNWAAATAALPAANAGARTAAGRYALGRLQYDLAVGTQNRPLLAQAIEIMLSSTFATPQEQAQLLRTLAGIRYEESQVAVAQEALERAQQLAPNDPETAGMLAQVYRHRGDALRAQGRTAQADQFQQQSLAQFQRTFQLSDAAGVGVPESRVRVAFAQAFQAQQRPLVGAFGQRLLAAFPSPTNWRDVLFSYRDVAASDPTLALDVMRLARAAGALHGERDYLALTRALDTGGLAAEAKVVLDEGIERNMLSSRDTVVRTLQTALTPRATRDRAGLTALVNTARSAAAGRQARIAGDTLAGIGRYAEAAELYRAALTKTGEDANLLNLRLGAALAQAGQRAEAEAALRLVTGERAELAGYWLAWLARRPAA